MDTTAFFNYPTAGASAPAHQPQNGLLAHATADDWSAVLAATETLRFHPGDTVLRAGDRDRAFYILLDGRLVVTSPARAGDAGAELSAPAVLGAAGFIDGDPRAVTAIARGHGELARMSWDAYEALAARDPRLGRDILLGLGRGLAARLRVEAPAGWAG